MVKIILSILCVIFSSSCTKPKPSSVGVLQRYVLTADLKDDENLIREYDSLHSSSVVWPEVTEAAKKAGFHSIEIYRDKNHLTMILEVPADADLQKADSLYKFSSPKIKEWASLMLKYQQTQNNDENKVWTMMKPVYQFDKASWK